ncbi:MAG TPA: hypothetical protein VMY77_18610 [Chitinophagaceae bacterium]|nr:hypothetical protein [Chitinophagaceae bacterium]
MNKFKVPKKVWIPSLWIIILIALANLFPLKPVLRIVVDESHYKYGNATGTWTFIENPKGTPFNLNNKILPREILINYPKLKNDSIIYRCFRKDPWAFWRWGEYLSDKRYLLPYKNSKKIISTRGYSLKYSNNLQSF